MKRVKLRDGLGQTQETRLLPDARLDRGSLQCLAPTGGEKQRTEVRLGFGPSEYQSFYPLSVDRVIHLFRQFINS